MPRCLPATRMKDTPMNYILPVISKLLSNYRTPRVMCWEQEPPLQQRETAGWKLTNVHKDVTSCRVGVGVDFFFFFTWLICIFFFHNQLGFRERDGECMCTLMSVRLGLELASSLTSTENMKKPLTFSKLQVPHS